MHTEYIVHVTLYKVLYVELTFDVSVLRVGKVGGQVEVGEPDGVAADEGVCGGAGLLAGGQVDLAFVPLIQRSTKGQMPQNKDRKRMYKPHVA